MNNEKIFDNILKESGLTGKYGFTPLGFSVEAGESIGNDRKRKEREKFYDENPDSDPRVLRVQANTRFRPGDKVIHRKIGPGIIVGLDDASKKGHYTYIVEGKNGRYVTPESFLKFDDRDDYDEILSSDED